MPLPENLAADLEAIDAALAGDAVDPAFAELAELALLLADSRPELSDAAVTRLDVRISGLASKPQRERRRRPMILRPALGAGLAAAAALVVVVVLLSGTGSGSSSSASSSAGVSQNRALTKAAKPLSSTSGSLRSTKPSPATSSLGTRAGSAVAGAPSLNKLQKQLSPALTTPSIPTPQANGQKIVQSSQLTLTAPNDRIATVSQELFDAVGAEQGFVKRSSVSSGSGGYATFTLSIPTRNLSATLARLTALQYSRVASSTEDTTDVTDSYQDDERKLADAKALHTSLLRQLAAAHTTQSVDSLKSQISDNESTITSDENSLDTLQGRISYTAVSVQINPGNISVAPAHSGSGGFSLHQAAHDALRVLTVAAGVVLIALAVLVPLGVVAALGIWLGNAWRRRRRESVLDAG